MNFLRKMFGGTSSPVAERPMSLTNTANWVEGSASGEAVTHDRTLALSAVWACTSLVVGTLSTLPLQVFRPFGEDYNKVDRKHPLYRILHDRPNADQTAVDFLEFLGMSIELWGNGYAYKSRISGRIVALIPLKPDTVVVRRVANKELEYEFTLDGKRTRVGSDDMLHIRGPGGDPRGGMSTLAFARGAFATAIATDNSSAAMFRNSMRPSSILSFSEFLTKEQRAELNELISNKFQSSMNAGRPFVAEGGMTYSALSISPIDAQLLESRSFSVEEICRFFGVPPVMIGHTSKTTSWPQGVEQQVLIFLKFTMRRRLKRIEQAMHQQLLTAQDRAADVQIEFNLEGLLRGDSTARSAFYDAGLRSGWMTINEVRARENLPPVSGGDVPRMQMQNVPITDAGKPAAEPTQ